MRKILYLLLISYASITLISCSKRPSISIAGSSTLLPIITLAAEKFKLKSGINVIVNAGGSGVGINQLGQKNIDIGMSSRAITAAEKKQYTQVNFITHTIGKDAVVAVVSSEIYNSGVRSLSIKQVANIYLGKIQNWQELGGSDKEILVIDKDLSRGTRHVFMQFILGNKQAHAPGADLVLGSNNEEQAAIVQSDSAIGMLSHAWLNKDIKPLALIMPSGDTVTASMENIANGKFLLTRQLLLITNNKPQGNVKAFIDYLLGAEGQKIVTKLGYVSIRQ